MLVVFFFYCVGNITVLSVWEGLQALIRGESFCRNWVQLGQKLFPLLIFKDVWIYVETSSAACYTASSFPSNTPTHSASPPFGLSCNKMSCLILFMGLIFVFSQVIFPIWAFRNMLEKSLCTAVRSNALISRLASCWWAKIRFQHHMRALGPKWATNQRMYRLWITGAL